MKNIILISFTFFYFNSYCQLYSRIEADFSIKESGVTDKITIGTVYYDKFIGNIIYDITYPQKEKIVVTDTLIYRIIEGKEIEKKVSNGIVKFSVFNLVLNGKMDYYGLKGSPYELSNIETEEDQTILTWTPNNKLKGSMGEVKMSQKNNLIFGLISYFPNGNLISKQFFEDYANVRGIQVPKKITQITYFNNEEQFKVTTYRNVNINNFSNEKYYRFSPIDAN